MGRIGRGDVQQTYSVRFRDDSNIEKLFTDETDKPEVINMNILFNSHRVKYENGEYIMLENQEEDVDVTDGRLCYEAMLDDDFEHRDGEDDAVEADRRCEDTLDDDE
jgi:hypothetical protein